MYKTGRILSGLTRVASFLGTLCIVLMMLHVTADVAGRYLFNRPLPGTIAIVGHFYMIAVVFIALGVAEEQRAHISVEFLTDMLPDSFQGWIAVFSSILSAAVFGLLAVRAYEEAMKKKKVGAAMEQGSAMIPVWQSYWFIPLGAGLIALICIYKALVTASGSRSGLRETDLDVEIIHD